MHCRRSDLTCGLHESGIMVRLRIDGNAHDTIPDWPGTGSMHSFCLGIYKHFGTLTSAVDNAYRSFLIKLQWEMSWVRYEYFEEATGHPISDSSGCTLYQVLVQFSNEEMYEFRT